MNQACYILDIERIALNTVRLVPIYQVVAQIRKQEKAIAKEKLDFEKSRTKIA